MCTNCPELAELQKTIPMGNQILVKKGDKGRYIVTEDDDGIFLPTDKQLHILVDFKYEVDDPYFIFIKNSYHKYDVKSPFNIFRSFEQYALAYVMKTRYEKVWFKNEWIKISDIVIEN